MLTITLTALTLLISLPAINLLLITLMSHHKSQRQKPEDDRALPCSVSIVIPAHNEEHHIAQTVRTIRQQLRPSDEILVIADNCTDNTAKLAQSAGARVVERTDPARRGKAHALEHARQELKKTSSHPEVVVVVDADCDMEGGSVAKLCQAVQASQGPVQALNLMYAPPNAALRTRLLAFAFLFKNRIRPTGLARLGAACTLTGTGMAFPWLLFATTPLASDHLAEDMALSKWLAGQGIRAQLCLEANIKSTFPEDPTAQHLQKKRWEHGHMATLFNGTGSWIIQAIRQRQWADLFLIIDTLTPPLSLYLLILSAQLALLSFLFFLMPETARFPLMTAGGALLSMSLAIIYAWHTQGRQLIHGREWFTIPLFIVWKLPIYLKYLTQRTMQWQRTQRPNE